RLRRDRRPAPLFGERDSQARESWPRRAASSASGRRGVASDPIVALKQELLAAAARQQGQAVVDAGVRRLGSRLSRKRLLLMSTAALSVAAGLALFLSAPWS